MKRAWVLWASSLAALLWTEGKILKAPEYSVTSEKLPEAFDGFRLVLLSDLHGASFGADNSRLLDRVSRVRPDLVLLGGDLTSRSVRDFSGLLRFLGELARRFPCVSVPGNHEQRLAPRVRERLEDGMRAAGIRLLDNSGMSLERDGAAVRLWGLTLPLRYYHCPQGPETENAYLTKDTVKVLLGDGADSRFQLLLTHNPLYFPAYAGWGADLTLCGHVHGGVVRIPGAGGLLSPERSFFPRYSAGCYERDGKRMIVSRGLGDFRVNNPPELPVIILRSGPAKE